MTVTGVQRQLDEILPGYEAIDATAHDWLADEFSRGTWAIHRPGWYEHHHAAMQRREGRVLLAGSDLADGWAGFIDGAIESRAAGRAGRGGAERLFRGSAVRAAARAARGERVGEQLELRAARTARRTGTAARSASQPRPS